MNIMNEKESDNMGSKNVAIVRCIFCFCCFPVLVAISVFMICYSPLYYLVSLFFPAKAESKRTYTKELIRPTLSRMEIEHA